MAKTILIVDDSASLRQVVAICLRKSGYEVIEASDGQVALDALKGRKVHLIISDVNMPNMDGITFTRAVKTLPEHRFTPVIMLTTESSETRKMQGKDAGAKAWMVKPFKPEDVLAAVSRLVMP